jgi:uncharacterized DUF497 family protein
VRKHQGFGGSSAWQRNPPKHEIFIAERLSSRSYAFLHGQGRGLLRRRMKYFSWDPEKNEKLKAERNISFEEIVFYIERGKVLDILEHPNKEKYPNQFIFVIPVEDYIYLVPFVEDENEIILKTIIPSRKATKYYLKGED